uniref:Protein argonaute N-terminal domain-containing protein n=1 Tax=Ditylenchus dipsaci TaxID=166011 RepID=A0A915DKT6_9BILA
MSQQTGIISCFLIKIANGAKAYHYEVKMYSCLPDREEKKVANKEVCISLLKTAQKKTKTFSLGGEVVFDGRAVLFTPAKIPSGEVNIVIKRAEADEIVQIHSNQQAFFRLQIQQTESSHELDLNNIDQYVSKTSVLQEDHTLRTFLELALSQHAIDRGLYTSVGKACLYQDNQEHQMGNGIVFRSGIHRSTRVVQNFGSPMPAVVLDCHTSAFFVQQSLIKTLLQLNNNIEPNGKDEWIKCFKYFEEYV